MSAKLTGAVWELDLPRPEKFVALALADHGKDDGTCIYPSLGRIEWKTGYSRTQVRQIMQSLVKMRLLFLVRKGGSGRGDCDEYRMEVCNIRSLADFRLRNKGAETAPMPSESAVNIGDKVAKGTETAPIYKDGFPQKGTESDPIGGEKGAVPVDKGYGFDPEKGPETAPEPKPNLKPRTKPCPAGGSRPSGTGRPGRAPAATSEETGHGRGEDADPRHQPFRQIVLESHATANSMPPELVTWDGREGTALKKFLKAKPAITDEQFRRCVLNYYRSDVNISRRPAEGVLRDPMAFWLGDTNEFDRPRIFTERFQHARKAAVGANR